MVKGSVFVFVILVALMVPAAALAGAPTVVKFHDVDEFNDPFLSEACEFEVVMTVDRHVRFSMFDEKGGNYVKVQVHGTLTATAADGGPTLVNRLSTNSKRTSAVVEEDGFLITEFTGVDAGTHDDWRGPGFRYKRSGRVEVSGLTVVDLATGEPVEQSFSVDAMSGRFDEFEAALFCEALTS